MVIIYLEITVDNCRKNKEKSREITIFYEFFWNIVYKIGKHKILILFKKSYI